MPDVTGFVGYAVSNCGLLACDVTIDALQSFTRRVDGAYSAEGVEGAYAIQDTGFQALEAFSGKWFWLFKKVVFPKKPVKFQFWAGAIELDGVLVPGSVGVHVVDIEQLSGHLKHANGPLTLDLSYESEHGDAFVSICTDE